MTSSGGPKHDNLEIDSEEKNEFAGLKNNEVTDGIIIIKHSSLSKFLV